MPPPLALELFLSGAAKIRPSNQGPASPPSGGGGGGGGIDATADWNLRKTGAILAVNFAGLADITAARAEDWYGQDNGVGDPYVSIVSDHGLSGKCLRVAADPVQTSFDDVGIWLEGGPTVGSGLTDFWCQWGVWADDLWNLVINGGENNVTAPKIAIIDGDAVTPTETANNGELVIVHFRCRGFPGAYRKIGPDPGPGEGSAYITKNRTLSGFSNVEQLQNAIDAGTPASPANASQFRQRYGEAFDTASGICPEPTLGTSLSGQSLPDADSVTSGSVSLPRGDYIFFEAHLDVPNDRMRLWAAKYGEAPILLCDTDLDDSTANTAKMPPGKRYDQIHITNFTTNHAVQDGTSPSSFGEAIDHTIHYQDIPEIIVANDPIPFPGNRAVPGTSALAQAAAGLAAGDFVQMTGTNLTAIPADTDTVLGNFSNSCAWDSSLNSALFLGTTDPPGNITVGFCRYRESQDDWEVLTWPAWMPQDDQPAASHGYDAQACDPTGRTLLKFRFNSSTPQSVSLDDLNGTWTARSAIGGSFDTVPALAFWPEIGKYVCAHGFNTGPNRHKLQQLSAIDGTWSDVANAVSSTYHGLHQSMAVVHGTEYIVWGGGSQTNVLNRTAGDGTTIQTAAVPSGINNIECNGSSLLSAVAGKVVVYGGNTGNGSFYEYDPSSDTWSSAITHPLTTSGGTKRAWQKMITPISNFGVIMITDAENSETWLYRPTA